MAYFITDDCISCGGCINECPVSAISEDSEKHRIDSYFCMDCGACAEQCPVQAIVREQKQ